MRELLEGKRIDYPHVVNVTFKVAPKTRRAEAISLDLPLDDGEEAC